MSSTDDKLSVPGGGAAPPSGDSSANPPNLEQAVPRSVAPRDTAEASAPPAEVDVSEPARQTDSALSPEQTTDATNTYTYYDDYGYEQPYPHGVSEHASDQAGLPAPAAASEPPPPPVTPASPDEEDEDDDGMLRMSFLEHLEELRTRLIHALIGIGVAFLVCMYFAPDLWDRIQEPAEKALKQIGANPKLVFNTPTEPFAILWVKVPVLAAAFLASPWVVYQVWAFVSPGLYKRERKWAVPFILTSAGLFILGGLFAYFVAFPLGLAFLLGIGFNAEVQPFVRITDYFDLFFNVCMGMGLVFELPVIIFFLSLLRIVTPAFLLRNSRYAILIIVVVAAILTPTPDVINLMLISVPMTVLYFTGVFASYVLWLSRENRRVPWKWLLLAALFITATLGVVGYLGLYRFGYRLVGHWPFVVR